MDEIERIRKQIDQLDGKLLELLKERYEYTRLLGKIKKARRIPLKDPQRESDVLRSAHQLSMKMGLDPEPVRRIFGQVFKLSVKAQTGPASKPTLEVSGFKVLVIGGTHGMGLFFARLADKQGAIVQIAGRSITRTRRVARESGLLPGRIADVRESDIVVVSVPIGATRTVCLRLAPLMKAGSFLTDFSSVKTGIADVVARALPDYVEYVSLHPLFGPNASHVFGQNIIAIPFRQGPVWQRLARLLLRDGARIHVTTVQEHDRAMGYVQVLHHFGLICIGRCMKAWNGRFETSSLRLTLANIQRLVENWDTVVGIQRYNPSASEMRQVFQRMTERTAVEGVLTAPSALKGFTHVQKWSRKQ